MTLKQPKTSLAHILHDLIIKGKQGITERDFHYNSFRGRLSDLRNKYLVSINSEHEEFVNTFGHKSYFSRYKLATNKRDAIKIYNALNK